MTYVPRFSETESLVLQRSCRAADFWAGFRSNLSNWELSRWVSIFPSLSERVTSPRSHQERNSIEEFLEIIVLTLSEARLELITNFYFTDRALFEKYWSLSKKKKSKKQDCFRKFQLSIRPFWNIFCKKKYVYLQMAFAWSSGICRESDGASRGRRVRNRLTPRDPHRSDGSAFWPEMRKGNLEISFNFYEG